MYLSSEQLKTLTWQEFLSNHRNSYKSVWKVQKVCQVCVALGTWLFSTTENTSQVCSTRCQSERAFVCRKSFSAGRAVSVQIFEKTVWQVEHRCQMNIKSLKKYIDVKDTFTLIVLFRVMRLEANLCSTISDKVVLSPREYRMPYLIKVSFSRALNF